ncbi:response regulator [Desulfovibrio subterraneus]|uniref:response regulator n=1 Tax=Desulfovibrio subterraneus TaxID=2718620 RepID=UPI0022B8A741|nr:response regulator [Desulfovibrio subterraneus]WBF65996.1 response regulator [Desulfovibrio subterraneus]
MAQNIRVLIVDDELRFRENLQRLLSLRGFSVFAAEDGAKALTLLKTETVDVCVVDMRMPGMDGTETVRCIREMPEPPACIILTGHACVDQAVQGYHCGAAEYLLKPCTTDELAERIHRVYERTREQRTGTFANGKGKA